MHQFATADSEQQLRVAVASAEHDIRTPLQALMGGAELLRATDQAAAPQQCLTALDQEISRADQIAYEIGCFKAATSVRDNIPTVIELLGVLQSVVSSIELLVDRYWQTCSREASVQEARQARMHNTCRQLTAAVATARLRLVGGDETKSSPIELAPFLAAVMSQFQDEAESKSVILEVTCEPELIVHANPNLLGTIVWNLVSNAVKYTDRGRVMVFAKTDQGSVVIVGVQDTGIGIDPSIIATLMQFGERGQSEVVLRRPGSGIGLASAKAAADQLGTRLDFRPGNPGGTSAAFSLRAC